ncbi:MAG: hypothetical protein JO188_06425 [Hyphomicrobiales bacterium]|nr:hypothetical protein [Hyphomicrobiales bacterium]
MLRHYVRESPFDQIERAARSVGQKAAREGSPLVRGCRAAPIFDEGLALVRNEVLCEIINFVLQYEFAERGYRRQARGLVKPRLPSFADSQEIGERKSHTMIASQPAESIQKL